MSVALLSSFSLLLLAFNNARQKKKAVIEVFEELSAENHVRRRQQGTRSGARKYRAAGYVRPCAPQPRTPVFCVCTRPAICSLPSAPAPARPMDSQCIPGNVLSGCWHVLWYPHFSFCAQQAFVARSPPYVTNLASASQHLTRESPPQPALSTSPPAVIYLP